MLIRCYTCNAHIASAAHALELRKAERGETTRQAMDAVGITRVCCRARIVSHVDLHDDYKAFPARDIVLDDVGSQLLRHVSHSRRVVCDTGAISTAIDESVE